MHKSVLYKIKTKNLKKWSSVEEYSFYTGTMDKIRRRFSPAVPNLLTPVFPCCAKFANLLLHNCYTAVAYVALQGKGYRNGLLHVFNG